jgi:hypothetical protein
VLGQIGSHESRDKDFIHVACAQIKVRRRI